MRKIVVFGANGNLGRQASAAFKHAGWKVRVVTRDGNYNHLDDVEIMAADAMNESQVVNAAKGCDFIFNGLNPPYPQWSKMCMTMARNIMTAAKTHGAVHLFPGNVYNYGSSIPALIGKDTLFNADTKKGKIRMDMEAEFERGAREDDVQTIILRAGDFFGGTKTGSSWFHLAISKKLDKGIMTYPGPLDEVHSWAYLPDFARAFVAAANNSGKFKKFATYNFEGHAITGNDLLVAMEKVTGQKLKHKGMPWPLLRVLSLFSPMLREVCEMSYLWHTAHRLDGKRFERRIGPLAHTPLEQALAGALGDLGKDEMVAKSMPLQNVMHVI